MTPGDLNDPAPTTADALPRSATRMKAHTDPSWAIDRILELETEVGRLRHQRAALLGLLLEKAGPEVKRLREERQAVLDCVNLYGDETLHKALDVVGWPSGPSPAGPEMATGVPGRVEEDRRGAEAHGAPAPTDKQLQRTLMSNETPVTIVCNCAHIPPMMPLWRNTHLATCPVSVALWATAGEIGALWGAKIERLMNELHASRQEVERLNKLVAVAASGMTDVELKAIFLEHAFGWHEPTTMDIANRLWDFAAVLSELDAQALRTVADRLAVEAGEIGDEG